VVMTWNIYLLNVTNDLLSPIFFCKKLNHIYTSGSYPTSWNKAIILPVPMKGDSNKVNNFRGIALTNIFQKYLSIPR
jgi:hypothetical protein